MVGPRVALRTPGPVMPEPPSPSVPTILTFLSPWAPPVIAKHFSCISQFLARHLMRRAVLGLFVVYLLIFGHFIQLGRILVAQPGITPMPLAVEVWNPNHRTTKEFPGLGPL